MSIIDQFLEDYKQQVGKYEKLAQTCAYQCESGLKRNGLRALVTFRAKRLDSLMEKVTARAEKKQYRTIEEIYDDIVDLAGVRIALYFPGDRNEVDTFIRSQFDVELCKTFPEDIDYSYPYPKRFSGYSARHYRIKLKPSTLTEEEQDLPDHIVELQVGSVLMHSWAEVEHDLVYKRRPNLLSYDEYAILDELNGLMHAGEIALERLQRAVKRRIHTESQPFSNHYELSSFLYDHFRMRSKDEAEPFIGRADVLFRFLQFTGLDTVTKLEKYLVKCRPNGGRPIAQQIVDKILAENEDYYEAYNQARQAVGKTDPFGAPHEALSYFSEQKGLGLFMRQWISVQTVIGEVLGNALFNSDQEVESLDQMRDKIGKDTIRKLDHTRQLRDQILFGDQWPSESELTKAGQFLQELLHQILEKNPEVERLIGERILQMRNKKPETKTKQSS